MLAVPPRHNMPNIRWPKAYAWLPVLNFCLASGALLFQTTVLYPWHLTIDKSHDKLYIKIEDSITHTQEMVDKLENENEELRKELQALETRESNIEKKWNTRQTIQNNQK